MNNSTATSSLPGLYEGICDACGNSGWDYIVSAHAGPYHRCTSCRYHIQAAEEGDKQHERFEAEQQKNYDGDTICTTPQNEFLTELRIERRIEILTKVLPAGKLIEVGPGSGGVIAKVLDKGYQITAVEHSASLARHIEKELGVNVEIGEFEKLELPDEEFDAYMSFHVIEHVADVAAHLEQACRIVKPGGLAIIATPNADSWEHRLPFGISPNYSSAHLQLFSRQSMNAFLGKTGWEIVELRTPSYLEYWVRVVTSSLRLIRSRVSGKTIERGKMVSSGANKNSKQFRLFRLVGTLTKPIRFVQEQFKAGGELLVVARRIN